MNPQYGPPQQPYYSPPPPPHRSNGAALIVVLVVGLLVFGGCAALIVAAPDSPEPRAKAVETVTVTATSRASGKAAPSQAPASAPTPSREAEPAREKGIVLRIGGTAKRGSVTWLVGGSTSQDNGTSLPWTKALKGDPSIVSLTAQNTGASGTITCSITKDGEVVNENKSSGAYAVVSCSATSF